MSSATATKHSGVMAGIRAGLALGPPTFALGTAFGVLAGPVLGDPRRLGLDGVFVAFYLALLWGEVSGRRSLVAALAGGAIALVLMPVAPVGVPIVAASLAALIGLVAR